MTVTHTIEQTSPCERRITVTVEKKTVKKALQAMVRNKAKTAINDKNNKLSRGGFRPHTSTTQNSIAKQMTSEDKKGVHQKLCKDSFSSLVSKEKLNYQGTPVIESITPNEDGTLNYVVVCENYPDIAHVHWKEASLEKLDTDITEEALLKAEPLFKKIGLETPMSSKETATQWAKWMVDIFQRQKIKDQVIDALLQQNTVNDLPQRIVEERYQELKREHQEDATLEESNLREKAQRYITTDILFKAYRLEHGIKVDQKTFAQKIKEASNNPFIMSHIKDQSLLPYYLTPRIIEDAVIDHLVDHANCTTKVMPLNEVIALAFNQDIEDNDLLEAQGNIEEQDQTQLEQ